MTTTEDVSNIVMTGVGAGVMVASAAIPMRMLNDINKKKRKKNMNLKMPKVM